MAVDLDVLLREVTLIGPASEADLLQAITEPPVLERSIDGPCTLEVTVSDHKRKLMRSGIFEGSSWAVVDDGMVYKTRGTRKTADRVTMTFEDSIMAALRGHTEPDSAPAGSTSRAEWIRRLAGRAGVPVEVDPALERETTEALHIGGEDEDDDAWQSSGRTVVGIDARRLSDGTRLLVGSDAWLMTFARPFEAREHTGPVHHIDFELNPGLPAATASLDIDARRWAVMPGRGVQVADLGPASGLWLARHFERTLTRKRATLDLSRRADLLPEPPPQSDPAVSDAGELHLLPGGGRIPGASVGGGSGNAAVERGLSWAAGRQGLPYGWGAKGPNAYDCSGFVVGYTTAGGRPLQGSSKGQWAACQKAGRTIDVQRALATRGALLFRMTGEPTHVAISLGDGRTLEARGKAHGCGVFGGAASRRWTGGATWL